MTIKSRIQLDNREPLHKKIPLSTPWIIFLDPSSRCNFKCSFCPNSQMKDKSIMDWSLYKNIIKQIKGFEDKLKVLRLYMMGEPLLNKRFCDMVKYAKDMDVAEKIDTTTNASLLTPKLNAQLLASGIDRINISVNGINVRQYKDFCDYKIDYKKFYENIIDLSKFAKRPEIFIKINGDNLSPDEQDFFIDTYSPYADGISIEHTASCWPHFKVDNANANVGIYGQRQTDVQVCPYIFYSMSVHSNGKVSLCFVDWQRVLYMGHVKKFHLKGIWESIVWKAWQIEMLTGHRNQLPVCKNCQQLKYGMPTDIDKYAKNILGRML